MRKPRKDDAAATDRTLEHAVGKRIRELRLAKGMTQKDLSHRSEVGPNYIVEIEQVGANLSLKLLKQFADALGVDMRDLLPGSQDMDSSDTMLFRDKVSALREQLKSLERFCDDIITKVDDGGNSAHTANRSPLERPQ